VLRLVLDPGVYVSALLSRRGPPFRLIELWDAGAYEVVVSPAVFDELRAVLARDRFRGVSVDEIGNLFAALEEHGLSFEDIPDPPAVTVDPKDDYLVVLTRSAGAAALVSGDAHLVDLPPHVCRVLTPRAAVELVEEIDEAHPPA
jgi:putative PIN family toxin of toxin-antitoxin system